MPSVKPCVLVLIVLVAGCIPLSAKAQRTDIVIAPPDSVAVPSGSTVVFVCVAYVSVDAPSIVWRQEQEPLNSIADPRVNISERLVNRSGRVFLKSVLQLCGVRDVDAANYSCTAGDSGGVGNGSASFELLVTPRHVPVQIVITPDDRHFYVNSSVLLTCAAYGTPLPTITWSKEGRTLTDVTVRNDVVVKNGTKFVRSILQFCSTQVARHVQYACTADNEVTNDTATFQLTTQAPRPAEVVLLTEDTLVSAGNTILLTCIGYGDPLPSLSWERVGNDAVQNDRRTTIFESMAVRNGDMFARSILQICQVTDGEDTGMFSCTSGNVLFNHTVTVQLTVHVPVRVVISSTNIQINSGSTVLLTAFGYGTPLPVISWLRDGGNLTNSSQIKIFESVVTRRGIPFAMSVLEICRVDHSDSRQYLISASNGITVDMARLEISVRDSVQVVESPGNQRIPSGDTLVLSCVAYGVPVPSVSWSKNGSTLENNTQITILEELVAASDPSIAAYEHRVNRSRVTFLRSIIRIRSIRLIDSGHYSCSADNGFTNDSSSSSEVVVEAPVEILVSPGDTIANVGRTVLFSCIAYGFPLPTFTWRRDGSILRNDSSTIIYESMTTRRGVSFVKSVLEICSLRLEEDSAVYSCTADNMATAANASFDLDVAEPVEIVISSGNIEVNPGQTVLFTCVSQGLPLPSITWYSPSGGSNLSNETHPRVNVFESTETKRGVTFLRSILQLCNIDGMDSGDYSCFAENGLSNDTATIQLCARERAGLVVHPEDTEVIAGSTVMLACIAFGEPLPSITWSAGGVNVTNNSRTELLETQTNRSGVAFVKSVLQICSSGEVDANRYTCTAVNIVNTDRAGFNLTVISEPATLVVTPENIEILAGNSVTLTCVAFGYPIPTITWTKSDHVATTTLQNSSTVEILTRMISRNGTQLMHSTLFLCSSGVLSTASYSCTAFNGVSGGASTSAAATVNVKVLPTIKEGGGGTTSTQAGPTVSLVCTADGVPTPTLNWFKDGCLLEVALNKRYRIAEAVVPGFQAHIPQALRSTLTLAELDEKDSGNYSCVASNEIDTAILAQPYMLTISRASLNYCARFPCRNGGTCSIHQSSYSCDCPLGWNGVNCENRNPIFSEPSIVEGPQTTFVRLYQPASFTCTVSGNPQPTIMWYKDGSELVGERLPQLLIAEVHLADRGAYHCVVFGQEGNITSNVAFLNVEGITQYTATLILSSPTDDSEETDPEASLPRLTFRAAGRVLTIRGDSNTTTIHSIEDLHFFGDIMLTLLSDSNNLISARVEEAAGETLMQVGRELGVSTELVDLQRFDGCVEGTTIVASASDQTTDLDTFLAWSEAPIGAVVEVQCVCGIPLPRTATRLCAGGFAAGGQWDQPMHQECNFTDIVRELCLMPENDVVADLTSLRDDLGSVGIHLATDIMRERIQNVTGDTIESGHFFTAIDNILAAPPRDLLASHEEFNTSGRLLVILEELADGYPVTNETVIIAKNMFATAIYPQINTTVFLGEGFSADLGSTFIFNGIDKEKIGLSASEDATASINLPLTLFNGLTLSDASSKLVFSFFLNEGLFVRRREFIQNNSLAAIRLGSIVIAAHIAGGVAASSLEDPVRTTYITNPVLHPAVHIQCSYWDFSLDEGFGGWSPEGCTRVVRVEDDVGKVVCDCDHLTNFAVLLDVTPTGIGALAYIGGVICIVVLLPTVVYLTMRSLQSSTIAVLLINLCLGLIGLYSSFIASYYATSSSSITCAVFSALLHYFFLVSSIAFTVVVFVRFREFKGKEKRTMFIVTLGFMWLVPIVIVVVSVVPDYTNYVHDEFCRPVKWPYWMGMLVVSGILHLQTWCGLIVAPCLKRPISRQSEIDRPTWLRETCGLISSLLFYDIAWAFGLPATHTIGRPYNLRSSFQGIFIVASAMLGFAIFLFFCALDLLGKRKGKKQPNAMSRSPPPVSQLFPRPSPAKIGPGPMQPEVDELEFEFHTFGPEENDVANFGIEELEFDDPAEKKVRFKDPEDCEEITEF